MKQCQSFSPCQKNYSKNIDQYAHQGYTKANNTFDIETKPEKKVPTLKRDVTISLWNLKGLVFRLIKG